MPNDTSILGIVIEASQQVYRYFSVCFRIQEGTSFASQERQINCAYDKSIRRLATVEHEPERENIQRFRLRSEPPPRMLSNKPGGLTSASYEEAARQTAIMS